MYLCKLRYLLSAFILLLCFQGAYGQKTTTSFQHLSIENGLTSNHINCVLQDKNGFIWIGTNFGLNKFNGYAIKTFRRIEGDSFSLGSNFITCGFKDTKNRLWFGGNFLGFMNTTDEKFTNFHFVEDDETSISSKHINSIVEDDAGVIWIGTRNGLCSFNENTKNFTTFLQDTIMDRATAFARNFITGLAVGRDGILWVSTLHGLHQFNTSYKKFEVPSQMDTNLVRISQLPISAFCIDRKDNLWIASSDSDLFYLNRNQNSFKKITYSHYCNKSVSGVIRNLMCDNSGRIWLATGFNGIITYHPETADWIKFQHDIFNSKSLADDKTQGVFEDKSGLVWIGTHRGGIDRIQPYPDNFISYVMQPGKPNSLCVNDITIGLEDDHGNLWLGAKEGMMYFDRVANSFECFRHEESNVHSLSSNIIYTIVKDAHGNLWIGTDNGLNFFNRTTRKWKHYYHKRNNADALPGVEVFDAFVMRNGNIIIGTNGSVCTFNPTSEKFETFFNNRNIKKLRTDNYITVFESSNGNIWISTSSTGILHVDADFRVIQSFDASNGFKPGSVHQFVEDANKNIWMASSEGLYRWNHSTADFTIFNSPSLGMDVDIKSVVIENQKRVWISTSSGLMQISFKNENEIALVKKFDESDGLQGNAFNNFAGLKLNSGELFFGGINGFNLFDPSSLTYNTHIPPVKLLSFKVFDKELRFEKELDSIVQIDLNYEQDYFTFEMGALSFDHPEKNQFAYQLIGFDNEIIYNGTNRVAGYTNVPPGIYILHIMAANNDGVWNKEGTRIKLVITPPFWKTNAFRIGLILLLSFAAYLFYYLRIRKIRQEEKVKSEISKQIAEARLTALSAQMNPHFIFNSLNSIQQFISDSEKENALKYLSKFSRLIRLVLQGANRNTTTVSNELAMLAFYLELESLRFSNKFAYTIQVDETLNQDITEIPSMLLQPYVENAIVHGLLNKTTNGILDIRIRQTNHTIICTIEDNGIGRDAATAIKIKKLLIHESLGIKMTEERMQMIEHLTGKKVKITIQDLKDRFGKAEGTKVEIEISGEE